MNRRTAVLGLIASPICSLLGRDWSLTRNTRETADGDYIIRGEIFHGEEVQLENGKTYVNCFIACDVLHLGNARVLNSHISKYVEDEDTPIQVRSFLPGHEVSYCCLYNSPLGETNFRTLPSMPAGYEYARR